MIRTIKTVLLFVAGATLLACGGIFDGENGSIDSRGAIQFSGNNPTTVTAGSTVDVVLIPTAGFGEANTQYTVTTTASNGATVSPATQIGLISSGSTAPLHIVRVTIPANATVGTTYQLTARRTRNSGGDSPTVTHTLTVAAAGIRASMAPSTVSAPQGGNATSTLTITPVGGASGTVNLLGFLGDTVITPTSLTIPSGSSTPVTAQVTYRIPAAAALETPIAVPVRATLGSVRAVGSYSVTPTPAQTGTFTLAVSPSSILVSGGQVSSPISVTVTPQNGFTGNVSVNFALPGQGSLSVGGGNTNPFTLNIPGASAVTRSVPLVYTQGQGGAPMGTATITATSGSTTRTATVNIVAS